MPSPSESAAYLWSFRRCPYAIRARLALDVSEVNIEYREIVLRDKPEAMLSDSPKGTVPVLVVPSADSDSGSDSLSDSETPRKARVIDESLDVMRWALGHNDPLRWLPASDGEAQATAYWTHQNDVVFKPDLDRYKYANRHPEATREDTEARCQKHLSAIETALSENAFLVGARFTLADAALLPFVRQFHFCDQQRLESWGLTRVHSWLFDLLESPRFERVMQKRTLWLDAQSASTKSMSGAESGT